MSKEKKHALSGAEGLIPELRFPKFEKHGEWEIETLGNLTKVISKRNKENKSLPVYSINNKEGFLPQGEQFEGISSAKRNYDISLYKIIERNTFAYNPARINIGSIGYSGDLHNVIISSLYVCFKTKQEIDDEFLLHFFDTSHFYNEVENNVEGGIRSYLFYQNFSNITIPVPSNLEEQQKIASCLTSLDELIAAHSDKLDALKDHKKGLLQKLFPQEGESVPKVRFAEFEGDGEWEEKRLGDEEVSGFVNDKIDSEKLTLKNYISTDNMLPDYSGVTEASKLPTTNRVTGFLKGDILISNIRPYLKKVWKSDRAGGASNDVLIFRAGSSVIGDFLECILKNDAFINYVMQSAKGVKMPRGDKDSMLKYPTRIPKKKEQQKIASCLWAVDELITAQQEKIVQLQQHKKGLMQGLFPNPSASSGETMES